MKQLALLAVSILSLLGPSASAQGSDACQSAQPISGTGSFPFTTGTTGPQTWNQNCTGDFLPDIERDVWFAWTAPATGYYLFTTCGTTPLGLETRAARHSGAGCPSSQATGCFGNFCADGTNNAEFVFSAAAGQVHTFQLGVWPGGVGGSGTFRILEVGAVTRFCFGDGSGIACPCANTGGLERGCGNSVAAQGSRLTGTGSTALGYDTLYLIAEGMGSGSAALFFQGTSLLNGNLGVVFGDGIKCVGGPFVRLATKTTTPSGSATYPTGFDPRISVRGQVFSTGTRYYQVHYRNPAPFCTPATFNYSSAVRADWVL